MHVRRAIVSALRLRGVTAPRAHGDGAVRFCGAELPDHAPVTSLHRSPSLASGGLRLRWQTMFHHENTCCVPTPLFTRAASYISLS